MQQAVKKAGSLPVPPHIRNAPTRLMKEMGYGKNYKYTHNYLDAIVDQDYLPEKLKEQVYYTPTDRGYEKIIKDRMTHWQRSKRSIAKEKKKRERD